MRPEKDSKRFNKVWLFVNIVYSSWLQMIAVDMIKSEDRFSMRKVKMAFNSPSHLSFWKLSMAPSSHPTLVRGLKIQANSSWLHHPFHTSLSLFPGRQGCRGGAEASWTPHSWPMPNLAAKQETNIAKSWSWGLRPSGVVRFGSVW